MSEIVRITILTESFQKRRHCAHSLLWRGQFKRPSQPTEKRDSHEQKQQKSNAVQMPEMHVSTGAAPLASRGGGE